MKISCPQCYTPLDFEELKCSHGHQYYKIDGVSVIMKPDFLKTVHDYSDCFKKAREILGVRIKDPKMYSELPYGNELPEPKEWKARQHDLVFLRDLMINKKGLEILEIGGWNGWLSHHLVKWGHKVTAVDYFADEYDGLRAMKHYPETWTAIQMDLEKLNIIQKKFDVVIFNRSLAFFIEPLSAFKLMKSKKKTDGIIIISGMSIYRNPQKKIEKIAAFRKGFKQKFGCDGFLRPIKGYLDREDEKLLMKEKVKFYWCKNSFLSNLRSLVLKSYPMQFHGIYEEGSKS